MTMQTLSHLFLNFKPSAIMTAFWCRVSSGKIIVTCHSASRNSVSFSETLSIGYVAYSMSYLSLLAVYHLLHNLSKFL